MVGVPLCWIFVLNQSTTDQFYWGYEILLCVTISVYVLIASQLRWQVDLTQSTSVTIVHIEDQSIEQYRRFILRIQQGILGCWMLSVPWLFRVLSDSPQNRISSLIIDGGIYLFILIFALVLGAPDYSFNRWVKHIVFYTIVSTTLLIL